MSNYIPERGHFIWLQFNPQQGHEQAGRRPALVISPIAYNRKTGLALVCPVTNQVKGYSFEVAIPETCPVTGVVLSDQVKNSDWRKRGASFICEAPESVLIETLNKLKVLIKY